VRNPTSAKSRGWALGFDVRQEGLREKTAGLPSKAGSAGFAAGNTELDNEYTR